ncbi:MAG: response regulator [Anaerolineae bacterium]
MAHILLVEDNAAMQTLLREMLEWGGHHVALGRTGEEALQVLEQSPQLPELIVSDLNMPRMDGLELLETVRHNPQWSDVRFIMMTANRFDDRITAETSQHLVGVLPKPFGLEDLASLLSQS